MYECCNFWKLLYKVGHVFVQCFVVHVPLCVDHLFGEFPLVCFGNALCMHSVSFAIAGLAACVAAAAAAVSIHLIAPSVCIIYHVSAEPVACFFIDVFVCSQRLYHTMHSWEMCYHCVCTLAIVVS